MRKDDRIRLCHMLDAAREAISFVRDRVRTDLETDRMLVLALIKEVEIIGEAANQVSQVTKKVLPGIPWDEMTGMRNRLVHAYFDINLDILWRTIQDDLPALMAELEGIVDLQDGEANTI